MKIKTVPLLYLLAFMSLHCAREVSIDLPEEETKVVAICHFTTGQHFQVNISLSQAVNDGSSPVYPKDLTASILAEGQFFDWLQREKGDGNNYYWRNIQNKLPQPGVKYGLVVSVPGYPIVEATSSIPVHYPVEPVHISREDLVIDTLANGSAELRIPLELRLQQLPPTGRYFAFYLNHDTNVYESFDPPVIDEQIEQQPTNFLADGRTISLLHNIPEPVVLINENYWADDRRTLYLTARIPFDLKTERPVRLYITWRTLSEDFYKYHLSISRQGGSQPISDPDAVYNNINGGLGNFSGYAVSVDTVDIPAF